MTGYVVDDEKRDLIVAKALVTEIINLHKIGDRKAMLALIDYLAFADNDSLARLYDLVVKNA